ncbi:MAG: hypothetical protein CSA96_09365 [Bacteroidetes bacterium]|nr:MAG: hypothetical protein CSA96_09365 [Bacteroidota bacterium]
MRRLAIIAVFIAAFSSFCTAQSARQYFRAGEALMGEKHPLEAAEQFSEAIALDPQYEKAYLRRGLAYRELRYFSSAASDFDAAIKLNPKDENLFYLSGICYLELEMFGQALSRLSDALTLKSNFIEASRQRMQVYLKLERYQEALTDAKHCLRIKKDARGYADLAAVYERLQMFGEAQKAYLESINRDEQFAGTYFNLAALYYREGALSKAYEVVVKGLQVDPKNLEGMLLKGRILREREHYFDAIDVLSLITVDFPDEARTFSERAACYRELNQFGNALADYSVLLALDSLNVEALMKRAEIYEKLDQPKKAMADYSHLLAIADPGGAKELRENAGLRLFELNREYKRPELVLIEPSAASDYSVQVPEGTRMLQLSGLVRDESEIKSMQVNDYTVPLEEGEQGYRFLASVDLRSSDQITIRVADVYDNVETVVYAIHLTEVDPPVVKMIAPYGSANNTLYLDSNDPVILLEGRVSDESLIRHIFIDSVSASYIPSDQNPVFSAMVDVSHKSSLTVEVEDEYGNHSQTVFQLNREMHAAGENPMGKTWVVFIENSDYGYFNSLSGPERDVALMKEALSKYQIHNVIHKKNMRKHEIERFFAIELRDLIRSNRVNSLLIWYAGHGTLLNKTGYWIPVDAEQGDEFSYYSVNALKASMQSYPSYLDHTLVVSDACETGPAFSLAMRSDPEERSCSDWEATELKSAQIFSSAGSKLARDDSQFTRTFAAVLSNSPGECLSIESVVRIVSASVQNSTQQQPRLGKIAGLPDENGSFFFFPKD